MTKKLGAMLACVAWLGSAGVALAQGPFSDSRR